MHPESRQEELFCVTCDVFTISDHLVHPWCKETRRAPNGEHEQHCGSVRGHAGPHHWTCDLPSPDGSEACVLSAEGPHDHGHEFDSPVETFAPSCASLVRTAPHGFVFRCRQQRGHEGAHVANVSYGVGDGGGHGYRRHPSTARWLRSERMVEHVPDDDGVRLVPVDEAPVTCGRCGAARTFLGIAEPGVTAWGCVPCDEEQFDVVYEPDALESEDSAHDGA